MIAYKNHYFSISHVYYFFLFVGQSLPTNPTRVILAITCGSHQLLSNESVHFSNGTAEVHSDRLQLGHAACKAVVLFEKLSGLFSEQTIPISIKYILVCFVHLNSVFVYACEMT